MAGPLPSRTTERARYFAQSLLDHAGGVADPSLTHEISIGPHPVSLEFTRASALTDLISGAFLPRVEPSKFPHTRVTICHWGDHPMLPALNWAQSWIDSHSVIPGSVTAPYRVFIDSHQGIIYCHDPVNSRAVVLLRHPEHLDLRSFITPFRLLWSWIARGSSSLVLHAATVNIHGRGVLLGGKSGSGKSTLTLISGLRSGNAIISDDCVLVNNDSAHPIYSRIKVDSTTIQSLSLDLEGTVHSVPQANAKSFIQIDQIPQHFLRQSAIQLMCFPVIYDRAGSFTLSPRRAATMLADDSMRELFGGTPQERLRVARLVQQIPSRRVLLGQHHSVNYENLEALLAT